MPITVKENIDVAGTPTTQGLRVLAEAIATTDAPTVARMRAAGAIPFARTNLPDLGLRVHTDSDLHGLTRNPWRPDVTAGGSSGGEASAIASGMSPLGLGNDIGGSLRNPAHCCGIASIKPSSGVVPMATEIEPIDMRLSSQLMVVEGPMARSVTDVRTALTALAGPDVRDPRSLPVRLTDLEPGELLTIAVMPEPPGGPSDPGIAGAVRRVADALADAGHRVVDATPPRYEESLELWRELLLADVRAQYELIAAVMGAGGRAVLATFGADGPGSGEAQVLALHAVRFALMREWSLFFAEHPVLLSPTWALPAFEHGADAAATIADDMLATIRPVLPMNLLGLPAAVVPGGLADGLPVGVQVVGDRFTDLRCLAIAQQVEDALGPITPVDPVLVDPATVAATGRAV